jgi:hypothetical protein
MNLACSGLAPNTQEADWLAMAGDNERLRNGMERLYRLFQKASVLGSLINPRAAGGDLLVADFHELQPLLEQALEQESQDVTAHEMAVTARGVAMAAETLATQFTLVATNVPYLARGKQDDFLKAYCERVHSKAKADLATCFVERCLELCASGGSTVLVTPQNWYFLGTYKDFRKRLLQVVECNTLVKLGPAAFRDMNFWAATTAMSTFTRRSACSGFEIRGWDASRPRNLEGKAATLAVVEPQTATQRGQLNNPDARIAVSAEQGGELLQVHADGYAGIQSGDYPRFGRCLWELSELSKGWDAQLSTVKQSAPYAQGREHVLLWEDGAGELSRSASAYIRGISAFGKRGVLVSQMNRLPVCIYDGELFDNNSAIIVPRKEGMLPAVWAFCASLDFHASVREIDQQVKVTNSTLVKVPFDLAYWQKVAAEKYPHGLPKPFSSDPTQWLFNGHPSGADQPLHVAVARLVGYLWPRQTGSNFPDCPALGPDGLESLADQDGIVCLSPTRGEAAAGDRLRGLLAAAYGDQWSSAKERELLLETAVANDAKKAAADLGDWLRQNFIDEHCKLFQSRPFIWQIWDGNPHGFSALVNYHKLASPNGQGRKTLELLAFTYLGDWIDRQKLDQAEGVNGADDRLAAALDLQGQLKKILEGEPPYDIFVRWKPLHRQAIGWDPDINDGVRLNIRPFLSAQLRKGGKTGAGILRAKPGTIKWAKDRGKEPMRSKEEFPWFWGWEESDPVMNPSDQTKCANFGAPTDITVDQGQKPRYDPVPAGVIYDGNRWNDLHYTRAAKEAARARQEGKQS